MPRSTLACALFCLLLAQRGTGEPARPETAKTPDGKVPAGDESERGLATYNYKDPPYGIYCEVGKGMERTIDDMLAGSQFQDGAIEEAGGDSVAVSQTNSRYCKGSSYCFKIVTDDVEVMKATFGDKIGDVVWDEYYEVFYVLGCEGMYSTEGGSQAGYGCENAGKGQVWGLYPLEAPDEDGVMRPVSELNITNPAVPTITKLEWTLEYCCSEHFCASSASSLGTRWELCLGLAAGLVLALW
mmetsp:Transcript_24405/g.50714  ORF Transcript_24405/g.50714 Transcript_24405/m.50714 type:complete len:242 (-) Transcript_24405:42-767(-)